MAKFYDKDKLHIIYYVNIENIDEVDVEAYIREIANEFADVDGSTKPIFIPVRGERDNMVEFHWPPYQSVPIEILESNYVEND